MTEVDKRIIAGFAIAFVLISVTMFFSYRNMVQFRSVSLDVAHTHRVLFEIEKIYAQVLEIESNRRGFMLYNDSSFRVTYQEKIGSVGRELDNLQLLVADNPRQLQRLDTLRQLIRQKIDLGVSSMEGESVVAPAGGPNRDSLRGKRIVEAIRRTTERMKKIEQDLLERRMEQASSSNRQFYKLYLAFGLITLLIFVSVLLIVRGRMKERIKAEAVLKARSDYIQDLYDNAPCGYHSIDADGVFVEANATFLRWLGYEKEELLHQKTFRELLTDDGKKLFDATFSDFKKNGTVNGLEFELVDKEGDTLPVMLSSRAVYDSNGRYQKDRATTFDITLRKQAEEKARFLNAELEAFSYSVSHDLRAPLRSIDSYTKILLEEHGKRLDDEGRRLLSVVLKNSARMTQLIDDLLDFSRVGRKELIKSEFSMQRLVEVVVDEMELRKNGRKVTLDSQVDKLAWGDKNTIRQVWYNLISNAVKYSSKSPKIKIEIGTYTEGDKDIFFVKDNGVGFDMAYYHKLFGVFQRLHSSREFDGTGVGLALCQRIVNRHEGEMWATSELGKGATFYFSLPHKT